MIPMMILVLFLCAFCVKAFHFRPYSSNFLHSLALYSSNNEKESYNKISDEFWINIQAIREYNPDKEESYFKNNINKLLSHRDEVFGHLDEACVLIEKTESESIKDLANIIDSVVDIYKDINEAFELLRDVRPVDEHFVETWNYYNTALKGYHAAVGNNLKAAKYITSAKISSTMAKKAMLLSKKHILLNEHLPLPLTLKHTAPAVLPIEALFDSNSVGAGGGGGEVDDYIDERGGKRGSGGGVDDAAKDAEEEEAVAGADKGVKDGESGGSDVDRPIACKPRFSSTDDTSNSNSNGDAGY